MSKKMKHCAVCGEEIASSAKVCPKCGAANKKPIYQQGWFIVVIIIGVPILYCFVALFAKKIYIRKYNEWI